MLRGGKNNKNTIAVLLFGSVVCRWFQQYFHWRWWRSILLQLTFEPRWTCVCVCVAERHPDFCNLNFELRSLFFFAIIICFSRLWLNSWLCHNLHTLHYMPTTCRCILLTKRMRDSRFISCTTKIDWCTINWLKSTGVNTNDVSQTTAKLNDRINCGRSSFWRLLRRKHGRIQGHSSKGNIILRLINTYLCALFVWFFSDFEASKMCLSRLLPVNQTEEYIFFSSFIWRRSLCVYDE